MFTSTCTVPWAGYSVITVLYSTNSHLQIVTFRIHRCNSYSSTGTVLELVPVPGTHPPHKSIEWIAPLPPLQHNLVDCILPHSSSSSNSVVVEKSIIETTMTTTTNSPADDEMVVVVECNNKKGKRKRSLTYKARLLRDHQKDGGQFQQKSVLRSST